MSGARRLTIYEPFRSIFYAPQFVALYGGHFAGEGLDVEVRTAGLAAFRNGHGDFFETGQPFTEQLIAEGAAHLVASMGDATGPVPFSSYMTTGRFLGEGRDVLLRFTRALSRAQRWMAGVDGKQIADVIAPAFPNIASDVRHRAVARYLGQDTWARDPMLDRPGYEYL